jgi:hypothetical protein
MPAFHLLRCLVDIGFEHTATVFRDRTRPIVFPELPILQFLHGEEAITEVFVVGQWNATNDEVLQRLQAIYSSEVVQAVYPGARPRLPLSDASVPKCTMPIYKPAPTRPDSPDPRLRPLDQFTVPADTPVIEAPPLPPEDEPTADEIAAHAQDEDEDEIDLGLGPPGSPSPGELPRIVRDTHERGSSRRAGAAREPSHLPDVNAGGSHPPNFVDTSHGVR